MTILVPNTEKKLLEIRADSGYGEGTLCLTDSAIAYEVNGRGIYLNFLPCKIIKKFESVGPVLFGSQRFRITWMEETEHKFEFRTRQHKQLNLAIRPMLKSS